MGPTKLGKRKGLERFVLAMKVEKEEEEESRGGGGQLIRKEEK